MSVPAIETRGLSVRARGQTVLESIDWTVEQGSFVGLIGPNGAGKTVLLKTLLGLIRPSEGSVRIFGMPPEQARRMVSYVPQYAHFDSDFPISVEDVVLMGRLGRAGVLGRFSSADRACAAAAIEKLSLGELRGRQIGRLSGGQLQRVLVARALAAEPKMLFLDEPTASLDPLIGTNVYQLLTELGADMTIILVSHDIGAISSHVKTIACLNRRLHYHASKEVSSDVLAEVYGCPIDLIAHGHAHRVLPEHEGGPHAHDHHDHHHHGQKKEEQ